VEAREKRAVTIPPNPSGWNCHFGHRPRETRIARESAR